MSTEVWSKADLHIHSNHSDGIAKIPEIMEYVATATDLKVIAITDHNTIEGALFAKELEEVYGVEVIVGEEVSSSEGHIIGLFLSEEIPAGLTPAETIGRINDQGGIAIIPHPFSARGVFGPFGGSAFLATVSELAFHAVEVYNSVPYLGWANRMAARMFKVEESLVDLRDGFAVLQEERGAAETYGLSPVQADAILRLTLGQLVNL